MGFLVWIPQTLGPKLLTEGICGVVESPSVEIFQTQPDAVLGNLL